MVGKTVGKYRFVDRLGRGGMGTVYKAVDETLDREVAIKVLNPDLGESDLLKRFRAEAVTLARLNHPGIATLYELHRHGDDLLMVMEYVRGETFHDLSERLGPIAPAQAANLCMQVLDALAHAHRAGIVHRDLKPANLMITETGSVKVMDFGIARVLGTEHFTQGGYMMGTPAYMAPEQVMGNEIDARADLYSVGVVLYRLLTAKLPFEADTAIGMVQKQITAEPTPIRTLRPDLPEWCAIVIVRALAKSPADRFQSAEEFRTALQMALRPDAFGELPTMLTPTPPGLLVDPEVTLPYDVGATLASAAAVDGGSPARGNTVTPAGTGGLERTTGTTVVLGKTHLALIAALFVVLAAGVAVLGFAALRRNSLATQLPVLGTLPQATETVASDQAPTDQATGDQASDEQGAGQPEEGSGSAPGRGEPPAIKPPSQGEVAATAGARGAGPTDATVPAAGSGAAPAGDAKLAAATPETTGVPSPPREAAKPSNGATAVEFDDVRVLMSAEDGKGRERDAILRLGAGRVAVLNPDGSAITALPYSAVVSAFYSRSKQPKWKDANGKEVESKADLGRLGFFRGERNWLILVTKNEPVILRIADSDLKTVLPTFTEQTGIAIQR